MHRQVGDLRLDGQGLARRGLLVRHLVMPGGLDETREITRFLASLSRRTYVNVMEQYRPLHLAAAHPPINRPLAGREYEEAVAAARRAGLERLEPNAMERLFARLGLG